MNLDEWLAGPGAPVVEAMWAHAARVRKHEWEEGERVFYASLLRAALTFAPDCETCGGTGEMAFQTHPLKNDPCPACDGSGKSLPLLSVNEAR